MEKIVFIFSHCMIMATSCFALQCDGYWMSFKFSTMIFRGCHSHRLYSHSCNRRSNFDQLFSMIWPLTMLSFRALTNDHVAFQPLTVDYAHIYGIIHSDSTPSLPYSQDAQLQVWPLSLWEWHPVIIYQCLLVGPFADSSPWGLLGRVVKAVYMCTTLRTLA